MFATTSTEECDSCSSPLKEELLWITNGSRGIEETLLTGAVSLSLLGRRLWSVDWSIVPRELDLVGHWEGTGMLTTSILKFQNSVNQRNCVSAHFWRMISVEFEDSIGVEI